MSVIPELEHHCGSWVIVRRDSGQPALETFSRSVAESVNQEKFEVLTTLQHLARLNKKEAE